jgi:hypothetical protein
MHRQRNARGMHVGMAYAAIQNFDLDIVVARVAAVEAERDHIPILIMCGISADIFPCHESFPVKRRVHSPQAIRRMSMKSD